MKLRKAVNEKIGFNTLKISFTSAGVISFNKHTTKKFELEGKSIDLLQDEENLTDWYLHISENSSLQLRMNSDVAQVSSTSICNEIKKSNKHLLKKTLSCLIGETPVDHDGMKIYPLLITPGTH
jgi:hypothetical protein